MLLLRPRCKEISAIVVWATLLFAAAPLASPANARSVSSQPVYAVASRAQEHALPKEWSRLLHKHAWSRLDSIAERLRSQRLRFQGGGWELHVFYCVMGTGCLDPTGARWQWRIATLKSWRRHSPSSPTPRIALADAYEEFAWEARGGGEADSVTPLGWKLFAERVAKARKILDESERLGRNDPGWYDAMLHIAIDQGWHAGKVEEFSNDALLKFPGYFYLVRDVARYFLPQWYGLPGNAAKYVEVASDGIGGPEGKATYFFVAEILLVEEENCDSCKAPVMSWPRIKRGFAAVKRLYGTNNYELNALAFLAVNSGHPRTAHQAFQVIGQRWDHDVWQSRAQFDSAHLFAEVQPAPSAPTQ